MRASVVGLNSWRLASFVPRAIPLHSEQTCNPIMESEEKLVDHVFATDSLWKPSAFLDDPNAHESFLFEPLELDRELRRVSFLTRRVASNRVQSPP